MEAQSRLIKANQVIFVAGRCFFSHSFRKSVKKSDTHDLKRPNPMLPSRADSRINDP
jgi:hypothetical protein